MKHALTRLGIHLSATIILAAALIASFILAFPAKAEGQVTVRGEVTMNEFVAAVQYVAENYHTSPIVITVGDQINGEPIGENRYVSTMAGIIVVNSKYANNPALLEGNFAYDVYQNFHSPGCTAQTYIGFHEAAHQIYFTKGGRAGQIAWDWAGTIPRERANELSGYSYDETGKFYPPEALAEAFASVLCDPEGSTPAEYDLYTILVAS